MSKHRRRRAYRARKHKREHAAWIAHMKNNAVAFAKMVIPDLNAPSHLSFILHVRERCPATTRTQPFQQCVHDNGHIGPCMTMLAEVIRPLKFEPLKASMESRLSIEPPSAWKGIHE